MRTAEEIKRLAYQNKALDVAEPSEMCLWIRMLYIYKAYSAKLISFGEARAETSNAEQDFKTMQLLEECYNEYTSRKIKAERVAARFMKNPTEENALELLKILMPEAFWRKEKKNELYETSC